MQAVYEEDLIHRQPGDVSTLSSMEQGFPPAACWVEEENAHPSEAEDHPEVI